MGKKTRNRAAAATSDGENPRRPCPCGSGKRYKACHGAGDDVIVIRPFEGLACEPDLVAMREFLPSATAPLPVRDGAPATLASVLPGASAALVRDSGEILLGMQVQTRSGDLAADLAAALNWARAAEPGSSLPVVGPSLRSGERLQDLLDTEAQLDLTLHKDFGWWLAESSGRGTSMGTGDAGEPGAEAAAMLERANSVILPTEQVEGKGVRAAYWVDTGSKAHLRWVRPEPEDRLMAALARLSERGELALSGDSRYAGSFRAHGLLVPVWDLDQEMHSTEWSEPVAAFAARLEETLSGLDATPLSADEHRARDVLAGKQITLR
ncbi:MAG: SEC-C domain-containing protein [Pseudonocardia sp.]|nr:SEC-C domain-containing protein [Pseudonocardia sp.]